MTTETPIFSKNKVPPLVKVAQVAALLSVCNQTVYKLIDAKDLEGENISPDRAQRKHLRITRESLLHFYRKRFGHSLERALANQAHDS